MTHEHLKDLEAIELNDEQLFELRKLVAEGEGAQLEFKRRASHPDRIVRELIAFANTNGGTLLVGVNDDGDIPGVKFPEEECMGVYDTLVYCKPKMVYHQLVLALPENRFVVRYDVPQSDKRPHYYDDKKQPRESYVRVGDMSIKASAEMQEIIKRAKKKKDTRFTYGEDEKLLMEYLQESNTITLDQFRALAKLNRFKASRKLILLVLANVLKITASEKGDVYSRA